MTLTDAGIFVELVQLHFTAVVNVTGGGATRQPLAERATLLASSDAATCAALSTNAWIGLPTNRSDPATGALTSADWPAASEGHTTAPRTASTPASSAPLRLRSSKNVIAKLAPAGLSPWLRIVAETLPVTASVWGDRKSVV